MKKFKSAFLLTLVILLTFGLVGQAMAAKNEEAGKGAKFEVKASLEFGDLKDAKWAAQYIVKMQDKNVLQGFQDGTFRPNQSVTRVQAIVTAVRLMGLDKEAKAKPANTKLHFKDAKLMDSKYAWAKGYVVTALEHGLFDASDDLIMPDKPASRVWVASLLVKSLGFQKEALSQMSAELDFKDAASIPAGAVGYVKIAVDKNIVTGYSDGTFKPNKNVSRAEMAAFLDRTNDGMLENDGAVKVEGVVKEVNFPAGQGNGQIKVELSNKEVKTYGISPSMLIGYNGKAIRADQLAPNDKVVLIVKDQIVVEAKLVDVKPSQPEKPEKPGKPELPGAIGGIVEFDLEVELVSKESLEMEYKVKRGKLEASVEKTVNKKKEKLKGEEAVSYIEELLNEFNFTEDMKKDEALKQILSVLNIKEGDIAELELEIKFESGKKLKIDIDNDEDDDDEDE